VKANWMRESNNGSSSGISVRAFQRLAAPLDRDSRVFRPRD
jgi:hypothetical protein